jgi:hypothetical protein
MQRAFRASSTNRRAGDREPSGGMFSDIASSIFKVLGFVANKRRSYWRLPNCDLREVLG